MDHNNPFASAPAFRAFRDADTISHRFYNFTIGALLVWGFALTAMIQSQFSDLKITWPVIIGYIICVIVGVLCSHGGAILSLIGYHLIIAPMAIILGPFLAGFSGTEIQHAMLLTGGIMFSMMAVATFWPKACQNMGSFLFWALLGAILFEVAFAVFYGARSHWTDYIIAGIFALYIAHDWAEAQAKPKTFDNAVDSVIHLFVDLINLFIRILAASKNDD